MKTLTCFFKLVHDRKDKLKYNIQLFNFKRGSTMSIKGISTYPNHIKKSNIIVPLTFYRYVCIYSYNPNYL